MFCQHLSRPPATRVRCASHTQPRVPAGWSTGAWTRIAQLQFEEPGNWRHDDARLYDQFWLAIRWPQLEVYTDTNNARPKTKEIDWYFAPDLRYGVNFCARTVVWTMLSFAAIASLSGSRFSGFAKQQQKQSRASCKNTTPALHRVRKIPRTCEAIIILFTCNTRTPADDLATSNPDDVRWSHFM